jgi:hypothetical protein
MKRGVEDEYKDEYEFPAVYGVSGMGHRNGRYETGISVFCHPVDFSLTPEH